MRRTLIPLALVLAVVGGACGGSSPDSAPQPEPTTVEADRPVVEPAGTPETTAPADIPPAEELDLPHLNADGTIPMETALQQFALAFGGLPGVEAPDWDVETESGTSALWAITQYMDELTPAQRDAVAAALGSDPLDAAQVEALGPFGKSRGFLGKSEHSCTPQGYIDEDQPGTIDYRYLVDSELGRVENALGETLPIPIYLSLSTSDDPETLAWASPQSTHCENDLATSCHVSLVSARAAHANEEEIRATIAHELVHCFQARWKPPYHSLTTPQWLAEGFADFVGQQLHPGGPRINFGVYTLTPYAQLFPRSYDAQGFFFHLHTIGGQPYKHYKEAFKAEDNMAAFKQLIAPSGEKFEDTWGSVLAFDAARGNWWYMPEAPNGSHGWFVQSFVRNGERTKLDAPPASNYLEHIDIQSDIVKINVGANTHGRVGFDEERDILLQDINGRLYCAKPGGCECPEGSKGSPPDAELPSNGALFALTATDAPAAVEVIGVALSEFCKMKIEDPIRVDPCLVGDWVSSEWTMPGPIPEMDGVGGDNAAMRVSANGQTRWDFAGMSPITVIDEQIDVTTSLYSDGRADGTLAANDGDWDVTDIDLSGITAWSEDNILGRMSLEGGPALFAGVGDGSYTCSGDLLSYSSVDPVENATVTVLFNRAKK